MVAGIGEVLRAQTPAGGAAGEVAPAQDPEAVSRRAEAAWQAYERARAADPPSPLAVDILAGHAVALADAAALLDDPRHLKRAETLIRQLLHSYRGGGDQLLLSPIDRRVSLPEASAAFASLARLVEPGPPWEPTADRG
jgi:hypothetical protein